MSLILFNKPYGVICQFSPHPKHPSLSEFIAAEGFYPAGRLDHDSEGLVLLTNEGWLQHRIAHPKHKLPKTYWVQVEGMIDNQALQQLATGVELKDGKTAPAKSRLISEPQLWPRDPPVRYRKHIPTSWIELIITEGRNRQVRRMTAAVGYPTLRLIRYAIGDLTLTGLPPGQWRSVEHANQFGQQQDPPRNNRVQSPRYPVRKKSVRKRLTKHKS